MTGVLTTFYSSHVAFFRRITTQIPLFLGPFLGGLLVPAVGFENCIFIAAGISLTTIIPLIVIRKTLMVQPEKPVRRR